MSQRDFLFYIIVLGWVLVAFVRCTAAFAVPPHMHAYSQTSRSDDVTMSHLTPQQDFFNFSLEGNYLPRATTSITPLASLPPTCLSNTECSGVINATSVMFEDCGSPWTICRCETGMHDPVALDTAIDYLARIPVGLRRHIATVLLLGDNSSHAYTLGNGEIHFFGDIGMDGWLHEASHTYDFSFPQTLSSSPTWLEAIGNDSCAPDNYSLTNPVEDFAQMSVMKLYTLAHYGSLPSGWEEGCMTRQLALLDGLPLFDEKTLFGTCDMDPGTAIHRDAPAAPDEHLAIPMSQASAAAAAATSSSAASSEVPTRVQYTSSQRRLSIPFRVSCLSLLAMFAWFS